MHGLSNLCGRSIALHGETVKDELKNLKPNPIPNPNTNQF